MNRAIRSDRHAINCSHVMETIPEVGPDESRHYRPGPGPRSRYAIHAAEQEGCLPAGRALPLPVPLEYTGPAPFRALPR